MRALHRKLWRDLATLKGQIAAIVIVLAAGVMTLIVFLTTLDALSATQDRFYEEHRFADLFADLVRAPDAVGERLRDLPGVEQVETRVRAAVRLEVEGFPDPVRGHLLSIPDGRQPEINRLYLRERRLPVSGRSDEVVVSEAFATAHRLRAGDRLRVIIRGSLEELTITGTALGPEFVYQVAPTDLLPDYERYAILWMNRRALASAYAMEGAFNNVVLTLHAGATPDSVKERIDVLQVPTRALFRDGEAWAVFVVESGRAMGRTVETGRRSGLRTEIRAGLDEGEWVVLHPGDRVEEGRRVEVD